VTSPPGTGPDLYGVGPAALAVQCDDPGLRASIGSVLQDLRDVAPDADADQASVRRQGPAWAQSPWSVWRHDQPRIVGISGPDVVTVLVGEVAGLVVERSPALVPLRAGAVERDGRAVVLLGRSEIESSRLALGLAERGWDLLGDALVLLDPTEAAVTPFWCPVEGAPGGVAAGDEAAEPGLVPASSVASLAGRCPLAALVVPTSTPGEPERLAEAETLAELAEHLAVVGPRAGAHVSALADTVGSLTGFRVHVGDLEQADASLTRLLQAGS